MTENELPKSIKRLRIFVIVMGVMLLFGTIALLVAIVVKSSHLSKNKIMSTKIMTKFINEPDNITAELLEGYVMAYRDIVKLDGENIVVRVNAKDESKVAIVTLGGAGHEPALSGFVGEGMLDCSVVGDVFAAPGAQRLFQALQNAFCK